MPTLRCPNCNEPNRPGAVTCTNCDIDLDYALSHPEEFGNPTQREQGLPQRISTYKSQYEEQLIRAAKSFSKAVSKINEKCLSDLSSAKHEYRSAVATIQQRLSKVSLQLGMTALDWPDPRWGQWNPSAGHIPIGVRFGSALFQGHGLSFDGPALVPILNQGNLIFIAKGAAKKQAVQSLQSTLLRLVATFPPGKIHLILVDPMGLGANVAGFMNLPEQIIGNRAWTEPQQIDQQLTDLSTHMENVIQKYLRNEFSTMEEYNTQAGEIAEPYRVLAVVNFPANFTDSSASRLISIASNGPRAGVYILCTIDADIPLPYGFNLPDLLRTGSVIEAVENENFVWRVKGLDKLLLNLDTAPPPEQFNRIVRPIADAARVGDRVQVPFEKVCPRPSDWWKAQADQGLSVPLGRRGAREIQYLELGQDTQHYALLAGKPGSGKSTLLHVLIMSLALMYPPDELMLYLVDFKKGVEFKDYAEFRLPHARVIGIETEREFGLSVLVEVQREMDRRGDLYRQVNTQDFHTYRTRTNDRLPRVFLIIDEFQRLYSEDDALAGRAANILAHIVQQGRAFGIHVLLASQTLADAYAVGRATYDKMSVRIALQCTEADSRLILGEDNSAARLLSRSGEAVYNALNGREEGNNFFQVAWLPDDKRRAYLKQIERLAKSANRRAPPDQVIFEGHIPSRLSNNEELWKSIRSGSWPAATSSVSVFMGNSTEISPPHTLVNIRHQSRSNVMIVGQSERAAFSLVASMWLSLCAHLSPEDVDFFVADFGRPDDPWATLLPSIAKAVPHRVELVRSRDFIKMLNELKEITDRRIQAGDPGGRRVFLILPGLHRARELRETDNYASPGEIAQAFSSICREGPDLGIHVVTWCDTFGNLVRILDRRGVAEFDVRVAMQMSEDDSNQFIESPMAKTLGSNRAYLYDLDQVGRLEKFRPYELIDENELDQVRTAFAARIR